MFCKISGQIYLLPANIFKIIYFFFTKSYLPNSVSWHNTSTCSTTNMLNTKEGNYEIENVLDDVNCIGNNRSNECEVYTQNKVRFSKLNIKTIIYSA